VLRTLEVPPRILLESRDFGFEGGVGAMIVIKIELHSAVTKEIIELGRMYISNNSTGTETQGNYDVRLLRKGEIEYHGRILRSGEVLGYKRKQHPVWFLISQAIKACYGRQLV
jgi:hypothetical protein